MNHVESSPGPNPYPSFSYTLAIIIMAMASPKLHFSYLFLLLPVFTSGTLVGFSYLAKGNYAATLYLDKVSTSHLRADLYLRQTSLITTSNSCTTSSQLVNHVNIGSIVIRQGHDLESALRSIQSGLLSGAKVSAAFSLPLLEKLSMTRAGELHRICNSINKAGSAITITVEDSVIGELGMGDEFAHKMVQTAKLAVSLLSGTHVPILVTVTSSALPTPAQVAEVSNKVCKYVENNSEIRDRVEGLYVVIQRPSSHRQLRTSSSLHDEISIYPTTPISTTPITIPPDTPFVTVPSTTPVPVTNPVTTPPVTNPVTTYPAPAAATTTYPAPAAAATNGQGWCVVKNGAPESSVQAALDYACGIGGADCSQIQQSGSCFNPVTLQHHASYAFNSYYQKNPSPSSCDFGGTATLTNANPSTGSCIFPSSSSSSSSSSPSTSTSTIPPPQISTPTPTPTPTPITTPTPIPTPTTSSSSGAGVTGSGTPPMVPNSIDPSSGTPTVFGSEVPPSVNTSTTSISATLQPLLACIALVTYFVTHIIIQ